jgi:hypothetical protein
MEIYCVQIGRYHLDIVIGDNYSNILTIMFRSTT